MRNCGRAGEVAYHLGNRHVPVEVGDGYLRLGDDHVLSGCLKVSARKLPDGSAV